MIQKIKNKWGIENNFQVIIILIVFAVTGSVSAWFSGPLAEYLKLDGLNVLHPKQDVLLGATTFIIF